MCVRLFVAVLFAAAAGRFLVFASQRLPDTSGIDGELTASLAVDKFFSLWLVFNNDDIKTSEEPFTIFAPRNNKSTATKVDKLMTHPDMVKKMLLDHIVLGIKMNLNLSSDFTFTTLGGRTVNVRRINGTQYANGAKVEMSMVEVPHGILVVLDDYLFPQDLDIGNLSPLPSASPASLVKISVPSGPGHDNSTFVENVSQVLSFLKSGVRVFRDFLSRSNVSHLIENGEEYTVLVPTDHAFQRWHPIDWGFYPFSVPEFTEMILTNHFVHGNLRQDNIKDGQKAVTLGGKEIEFSRTENPPILTVEGAAIVNGDTPVTGGNIMFIGEVLFVNDGVVQRLHQDNKDKETPPLLAFPWFGSQFLSHAFLALEENPQFTQITRFVNLADLAPHITGSEYTFFVPTDDAFRKLGLDSMPNNYLSNGEGFQVLLNHFVKGRLYKRDLTDGKVLHTLGNKTIHIRRHGDTITVNDADIVESEVFVYNLGTMYYINRVLFMTKDDLPTSTDVPTSESSMTSTTEYFREVENVSSELTEESGTLPDILLEGESTEQQDVSTTPESNDVESKAAESRVDTVLLEMTTVGSSTSINNNTLTEPRR
ncbi:periostin [Anabrus simplex]|uniref:periostin n=1 Tax=Anabrus simplex TaxID=316456 RepID=UPI0034DD02A2